jgi:hypothetical protein
MDIIKEETYCHCRHSNQVDYLLLSRDEFSILSDHLRLTYIYNPLLQTLLSRAMLYTICIAGLSRCTCCLTAWSA